MGRSISRAYHNCKTNVVTTEAHRRLWGLAVAPGGHNADLSVRRVRPFQGRLSSIRPTSELRATQDPESPAFDGGFTAAGFRELR